MTQSLHVFADNYIRLVNGTSLTAAKDMELFVLFEHVQDLPTARINLSPFTKDFRGVEQFNESLTLFWSRTSMYGNSVSHRNCSIAGNNGHLSYTKSSKS